MFILMLAAALAQPAGNAVPPGEAQQIGAYQLAYPYPSPDGEEVAFQSNMDGRWQLYAMKTADGEIRRLQVSPADDRNPAWSPDGTKLAFVSTRDGNDEVYVLDLASGAARSVAPNPGRDGQSQMERRRPLAGVQPHLRSRRQGRQ